MKIDAITLHNYKSFAGTTRIDDLSSGLTREKRVILFGGLNGAGKTTIFEAILLCLYGEKNRTLIPSKGARLEDYASYINSILNKKAQSSIKAEMWVELELSEVELGGIPQSLRIRRSWTILKNKSKPEEKFMIDDIDGLSSFVRDFSDEKDKDIFIEELIPYEVSQFFFFDGEKIQDFVKDEDEMFAESLSRVLGISSYGVLHKDLGQLRRQLVAENNKNADVDIDLKRVEASIEECKRDIERANEETRTANEEIREFQARIETIDSETRRLTNITAESWDDLLNKRDGLVQEKGALDQQIFETIKDNLPLVINAKLCEQLLDQLAKEQEATRQLAAQKSLEPKIAQIKNRVFYGGLESVPALTNKQKEFYAQKMEDVLKNVLGENVQRIEYLVLLHDLGQDDIQHIGLRIKESKETVSQLTGYLKRLQEIEPALSKIHKDERQIAKDPVAEQLYAEKGGLQEKTRAKEDEIVRLKALIDQKKGELESLQKQHTLLEKKVETTARIKKQIDYCGKLCDVLEAFSHEFKKQRAETLSDHTITMWKKLARKQDLIEKIVVDPERHFSIDLFDRENRLIDKTKLSAGEKELLAISLIWALGQIANRSLPIVIDTPLGRLDTEHRAHIAERYFPNTSHQVILLSTDTEIVGSELAAVAPHISKFYTISYDKSKQTSIVVSDSYFERIR